jgi:hypothetical protein
MASAEEQEKAKDLAVEYVKKNAAKEMQRIRELYDAGVSATSPEMIDALTPICKIFDDIVILGRHQSTSTTNDNTFKSSAPKVATAKDFGTTSHATPRRRANRKNKHGKKY